MSDQQTNWITHANRLATNMLAGMKKHPEWYTEEQYQAMREEVSARQMVVQMIQLGATNTLSPYHQVWMDYVKGNARLQEDRYSGRLDEPKFRELASEWRLWKDRSLAQLKRGEWCPNK
jgi:hypothetical protein